MGWWFSSDVSCRPIGELKPAFRNEFYAAAFGFYAFLPFLL